MLFKELENEFALDMLAFSMMVKHKIFNTQIIEVYFKFVPAALHSLSPYQIVAHLCKNKKLAHEVCRVVPFFVMFVCFEIITA